MGSPTLAAKEPGCANFQELRIKFKKMKSLRKKQADTLEDFLARIEECTANIGKLQDNVGELKLVQAKVLAEPSERERVKHLTKQQNLVRENKGLGSTVQKLIKQEKARNLKLAKNEDKSSELEIRRTQTQAAAQRFFQIWTEYNNTERVQGEQQEGADQEHEDYRSGEQRERGGGGAEVGSWRLHRSLLDHQGVSTGEGRPQEAGGSPPRDGQA